VGAVALLGFGQTESGRSVLRSAGLSSRDTPFTELAFADPNAVPASLEAVRRPVGGLVPFVIRNREGKYRHYTWALMVGDAAARRTVERGQIDVPANAQAYVNPRVPLSCRSRHVVISLGDPRLSIDLNVSCP
jgi:hypothetical protein